MVTEIHIAKTAIFLSDAFKITIEEAINALVNDERKEVALKLINNAKDRVFNALSNPNRNALNSTIELSVFSVEELTVIMLGGNHEV